MFDASSHPRIPEEVELLFDSLPLGFVPPLHHRNKSDEAPQLLHPLQPGAVRTQIRTLIHRIQVFCGQIQGSHFFSTEGFLTREYYYYIKIT